MEMENGFPHIDFGKELSRDEPDEILTQAKCPKQEKKGNADESVL